MDFTVIPGTNGGTLALDGEITLLRADQLKMLLADALEKFEYVRIDTEAVTDIDLACLQLICSAHRSAAGRGRHLTLTSPQSEVFKAKVLQTGMMYCHNCDHAIETDCLWKGGDR